MKKRKSPIALVSVLIICMIVIAAMTLKVEGGPSNEVGNSPTEAVPTAAELTGKAGPKRLSPLTATDLQDRPDIKAKEEHANAGSIVVLKPQGPYKLKPSDNSVRGQWYTPESNAQGK